MIRCKDCRFWVKVDDELEYTEHYCDHDSLFAVLDPEPFEFEIPSDTASVVSKDEGAFVITGASYGCPFGRKR